MRAAEWHDHGRFPRNRVRILLHDDGMVYIEVHGQHDGHAVATTVSCPRAVFAERIRSIGGLL